MRVIAGSARHTVLKTPRGDKTRPTQDRIKETLFNILQFSLPGVTFLDLFAGSGGMGIEALSRGASFAVFCDIDRECAGIVKDNLKAARLSDRAYVMCSDASLALKSLRGRYVFDMVFLDPPYGRGLEREALKHLKEYGLVGPESLIILEQTLSEDISWLEETGFKCEREKLYKTNKHIFVRLI